MDVDRESTMVWQTTSGSEEIRKMVHVVRSVRVSTPIASRTRMVDSRAAARALLDGEEWGKRQLVQWLEGVYREVTVPPEPSRPRVPRPSSVPSAVRRSSMHPVAESTVAILLIQTRNDVIASLERLMTGDSSFVTECQASGAVRSRSDPRRGSHYAAVHRPGMKLVDRVLALFAADYLNDPSAYREALTICEHCGGVSFEGECTHVDSGFFSNQNEEEQPFELVRFIQVG